MVEQYGRRAYGSHRRMSLATQARNIAESMRQNPGRDLSHYQLDESSELGKAVLALLSK